MLALPLPRTAIADLSRFESVTFGSFSSMRVCRRGLWLNSRAFMKNRYTGGIAIFAAQSGGGAPVAGETYRGECGTPWQSPEAANISRLYNGSSTMNVPIATEKAALRRG